MPEEVSIKITADSSEYTRALKEAQRELNVAQKLQEELARITREGGIQAETSLKGIIKALKEQYIILGEVADALRTQIEKAEEYRRKAGGAVDEVNKKIKDLKNALSEVEDAMDKIEDTVVSGTQKTARFTDSLAGAFTKLVGFGTIVAAVYQAISLAIRAETAERELRRVAGITGGGLLTPAGLAEITRTAQRLGISRPEAMEMFARIAPMVGGGVGVQTARWMLALLGARGVAPEVWGGLFQRLIGLGGVAYAGPGTLAERQRIELMGEIFATAYFAKADRRLPMFIQAIENAVSGPLSEFIAREEEVHGAVMGITRMVGGLANLMPGFAPEQVARIAGQIGRVLVAPTTPFAEALTYRVISEAIRGGAFAGLPFMTGRGTYTEVQMARARILDLIGRRDPQALATLGSVFMPFLRMAMGGAMGGQVGAVVLSQMLGIDVRAAATLLQNLARQFPRGASPEEIGRVLVGEMEKLRPPKTLEELMKEAVELQGKYFPTMADALNTLTMVGKFALPVFALVKTFVPMIFKAILSIPGVKGALGEISEEFWEIPEMAQILREKGFRPPPGKRVREQLWITRGGYAQIPMNVFADIMRQTLGVRTLPRGLQTIMASIGEEMGGLVEEFFRTGRVPTTEIRADVAGVHTWKLKNIKTKQIGKRQVIDTITIEVYSPGEFKGEVTLPIYREGKR